MERNQRSRSTGMRRANIDNAMLALSTYVGHAKVSDTYWYLTAVPDLMAVAANRFELFAAADAREAQHG